VLATDFSAPNSMVMGRVPDARVRQYWDRNRMLSELLGEKQGERDTIVWDWVAVFPPGKTWDAKPPAPAWSDRPVVAVAEEFKKQLGAVLGDN
jgi:hypothetical protein